MCILTSWHYLSAQVRLLSKFSSKTQKGRAPSIDYPRAICGRRRTYIVAGRSTQMPTADLSQRVKQLFILNMSASATVVIIGGMKNGLVYSGVEFRETASSVIHGILAGASVRRLIIVISLFGGNPPKVK